MTDLNFNSLSEIGNQISEIITVYKIKDSKLTIKLPISDIRKIDEDIYYRGNFSNEKEHYTSSVEEVILKFKNFEIEITNDEKEVLSQEKIQKEKRTKKEKKLP